MRTAGIPRSLVIRMLLGCILFSLFACGLHHGQMSAGDLRGALAKAPVKQAPAVASVPQHLHQHHAAHAHAQPAAEQGHAHAPVLAEAHTGHATPVLDPADQPQNPSGHTGHDQHRLTPAFSCPLCSSFGVALALNSSAWSLPAAPREAALGPLAAADSGKPRQALWTTLNPRAPPLALPLS